MCEGIYEMPQKSIQFTVLVICELYNKISTYKACNRKIIGDETIYSHKKNYLHVTTSDPSSFACFPIKLNYCAPLLAFDSLIT